MKITPWNDALFGSERVSPQNSASSGSDESLFSRLLKIESQLRAGIKDDSRLGLGRHNSPRMKGFAQLTPRTLSRYIE
jgi:hypothetical protein